jgi:hypothetical protein
MLALDCITVSSQGVFIEAVDARERYGDSEALAFESPPARVEISASIMVIRGKLQ